MRECPLNKCGPNNMVRCSAYSINLNNRMLISEIESGLLGEKIAGLKSRIDYLEDKILPNGILKRLDELERVYLREDIMDYQVLQKRVNKLEIYKKELRAFDSFENINSRIEELEKHPIFEMVDSGNIFYTPFNKRLHKIEDNIRDLKITKTAKLLNQNKIVADYAELLERISVTRGEMDEAFNRLEHHAAFYPRFKKIEKILTKFMKIFTKPLLDIDWTQTYRKVEKLIRELNR